MQIDRIRVHAYKLPLTTPFATSVRTIHALPRAVIEIETSDGLVGLGEAAPNFEVTGESGQGTVQLLVDELAPMLIGRSPWRIERHRERFDAVAGAPSAKAGLDIALWDLRARAAGVPLASLLGGHAETPAVSVPAVLGKDEPAAMAAQATEALDRGVTHVKIKVGDGDPSDVERIRAVGEVLPESVTLTVDPNQAWSDAKTSQRILAAVEDDVDIVEQPIRTGAIEELRFLRERTPVPVMADEELHDTDDARRIVEKQAADLLNVKFMKCGGITDARRINAMASIAGIRLKLGSMIEGDIATAAGVHVFAAHGNVAYNDLAGPWLADARYTDLTVDGAMLRTDGPGLGISIDRSALEELTESVHEITEPRS